MSSWWNKQLGKLALLVLLGIGFFYRLYGLEANFSFWTDENHVAIFARAIIERSRPVLLNGYSTGIYQWLQYWLSAISSKIFGLNEFAIRFPSVIFGVLTIRAIYWMGRELFNKNVGLIAAVFITFLKIEILWSRQARPYQALQFFYLLSAWFLYQLGRKKGFDWRCLVGFVISGLLASLMHGLGLIVFVAGIVYLLVLRRLSGLGKLGLLGLLGLGIGVFWRETWSVVSGLGKVNNLFYYRVFIGHNYWFLVILGMIGGLVSLKKKRKSLFLFFLFLAIQGFAASFLLGQPFSRYFYPVLPFLVLLAAVGLNRMFMVKNKLLLVFVFAFLLWVTRAKFVWLPDKICSLNEDMRETPEVDWKRVYGFVGDKLNQNRDAVLIVNWSDLPVWYLGEGRVNYLVRSDIHQETDTFSGARVISSVSRLEQVVNKEGKGLVVIDSWDDRVPVRVREYIKSNLVKELEVDRLYPVQPRYWPVEVYSWGFN